MKTDWTGGDAENNVTQELARLYDIELHRAERDFPTMRLASLDGAERAARPRMKLRLLTEAVAIVAVGAIIVAGGWLASNPQTPAGPAPVPSLTSGPDGLPSQLDGQRVYRIADESEWQKLSGSFLLAGVPSLVAPSCFITQANGPTGTADRDLIQGSCGGWEVGETMQSTAMLAPRTAALVEPWNGSPVVLRVHTHDAEAASCVASNRARCDASLVVEAVVWPVIPTQIAGEQVYSATDQAVFSKLSGSFLLGGVFLKPDFVPPCPMPMNETAAEQQLLPYCYVVTIGGEQLSPKSNIDEPKNELVVVRAHVNDPLAADCPATTQAQCRAAIVVESVVWRLDTLINAMPSGFAGPTPSGTPNVVVPPPPAIAPPSPGTPLPSAP